MNRNQSNKWERVTNLTILKGHYEVWKARFDQAHRAVNEARKARDLAQSEVLNAKALYDAELKKQKL